MREKESKNWVVSATSSAAWDYQNVVVAVSDNEEELPTQIIVQNLGTIDILVKAMDKSEGDAINRGGTRIVAGRAFGFEVENVKEAPFYRIGVKLVTGAVASSVSVDALKYVRINKV